MTNSVGESNWSMELLSSEMGKAVGGIILRSSLGPEFVVVACY